MSRIGKKPVQIPQGVQAQVGAAEVKITGPKGNLNLSLHPHVQVALVDNNLEVKVKNQDEKADKALWGLYRSLIANMVTGVTQGFSKKLEISGVGFKASVAGKKVVLNIGFSHPVELDIPDDLQVSVEKNAITVAGIDKHAVGQFAAVIRAQKVPEPYKGKGIKYENEVVKRKAGKAAKAVGAG